MAGMARGGSHDVLAELCEMREAAGDWRMSMLDKKLSLCLSELSAYRRGEGGEDIS